MHKVFAFNMRIGGYDQHFPNFPSPIYDIQSINFDKETIRVIGTEKYFKMIGQPEITDVQYEIVKFYPDK